MSKYLQLRITVTVFMLFVSSQVLSLTVYDVIQLSTKNYPDKDIITLIEVTNSAFELKADDIPRLLELGVSETVIQTMLKAVPEQSAEHSPPSPLAQVPGSTIATKTAHPAPADTKVLIAGGGFNVKAYQESGSGHHHHQAIHLAGANLFVLRHKGGFSSIKKRAVAAVTQLELAALAGKGTFQPDVLNGTRVVMFYGQNTSRPIYILNISTGDAYAYQLRSGRTVTPTLLAAYWSRLLSDYWSIVVNNVKPIHLADVHEGEALSDLYQQWIKPSAIASARLLDATRLLSTQTQHHLQQLATTVPHDFVVSDDYSQAKP
ncbi:hypothetical protein MNBD_GAMMA21-2657 [hydrothermal vent metagenome]|uniref:Uncharacterized protein n=1 Tax=hydrothermal vent metagenome TaxID=652676 RepID=A0A3B1ABV3_9ZZZZ